MKKMIGLLSILMFMGACSDKDPIDPINMSGELTLNLKAEYDGSPLTMFDSLAYGDGFIRVSQSEFLLSDITLINDVGTELVVDEIFYVNFSTNNTPNQAEQVLAGIDLDLGSVPNGSYNKIKFSIGVNSDLNSMLPADFPSSNPLSTTSHWNTWESFIFYKFQGSYSNPTAGIDDLGFIFHIGNDDLFRTVELPIDLVVEDNPATIEVVLEHTSLMDDGGTLFDIPSSPDNHTPILAGPMFMFADNYQSAFSN